MIIYAVFEIQRASLGITVFNKKKYYFMNFFMKVLLSIFVYGGHYKCKMGSKFVGRIELRNPGLVDLPLEPVSLFDESVPLLLDFLALHEYALKLPAD